MPDAARPLFVLTRGRTGSTLLQRLLNTHPALLVLGEHNGALAPLARAHALLLSDRAQGFMAEQRAHLSAFLAAEPVPDPHGWSTEWTNALTPESADAAFRGFVAALLLPPAIRPPDLAWWGFKEIRYDAAVAEFLFRLFPDSRTILLLRDPLPTARSHLIRDWWLATPKSEHVAEQVHRDCERLHDAAERLAGISAGSGRCRLLDHAELAAAPMRVMAEIAGWLGIEAFSLSKIATVLGDGPVPPGARLKPRAQECFELYRERFAPADTARWRSLTRPFSPGRGSR